MSLKSNSRLSRVGSGVRLPRVHDTKVPVWVKGGTDHEDIRTTFRLMGICSPQTRVDRASARGTSRSGGPSCRTMDYLCER